MKKYTQFITYNALLLALCVVFQTLKGISVYLTGSAVNAILIVATVFVGLPAGLIISIVAPLIAYLVGATPIINLIIAMLPTIMLGNSIICIVTYLFKDKVLALGLVIGSVFKALFLWLTVWYFVLPTFGGSLKPPVIQNAKNTFSLTQLITALIGSFVAYNVLKRLQALKKK